MIKNLAPLKQKLSIGTLFKITGHCRPEVIGEIRKVNYADTTGFYSITPDNLYSKVSQANGGKGSFLGWNKAPFWKFSEDGTCGVYSSDIVQTAETLIIAIRVVE